MRRSRGFYLLGLVMMAAILGPGPAYAKAALEINASVDVALDKFRQDVPGAGDLLQKAKGVLVFPSMLKMGYVLGGEYGEGALRIGGKTVEYYNMISGSVGLQLGGQVRRVYILFMNEKALQEFRSDPDWLGGLNASGVIVKTGAEGSFDTMKTNQPIMTFVLDQKGLMGDLNLEVGKINRIEK